MSECTRSNKQYNKIVPKNDLPFVDNTVNDDTIEFAGFFYVKARRRKIMKWTKTLMMWPLS